MGFRLCDISRDTRRVKRSPPRKVLATELKNTWIVGTEEVLGAREPVYLTLHCHHQDGLGSKMGSDVGHFNVSLIIVQGKSHETGSIIHNL